MKPASKLLLLMASAFILLLTPSGSNALPYFAPASGVAGYAPLGDGLYSPGSDIVSRTCGTPSTSIGQIMDFCSQACNATAVSYLRPLCNTGMHA